MFGRLWRTRLLFLLGLVLLGLFLFVVRAAIVPFIYASVLTYLLVPLVDQLQRRGASRVTAILFSYAAVAALLALLVLGVVPLTMTELDAFANMVPNYTQEVTSRLNEIQRLYSRVALPAGLRQVIDETIVRVETTLLSYVRSVAEFIVALFSHALAIIIAPILAFYMLRDLSLIKSTFLAFFPASANGDIGYLSRELNVVFSGFIRGHLLVSLIVGVLSFLGLTLLRVDFALLIGIVAGIFDVIPYFGPVIGALPAIIIALLESPAKALYVAVLFVVIHQLESTIISPKILGERVGLHPLTVIFALLVGGQLAGIVGVLLAVPLTAGLKVFLCFWRERNRWPFQKVDRN
ncbi:MAG: AI-2E family transporter [bacterium]